MPTPSTLDLRIDLLSWPDCADGPVTAALQSGRDGTVDGVPRGDGVRFEVQIGVKLGRDGGPDFTGPLVHGKPGERFLYVAWFAQHLGQPHRFRRLKLYLGPLERAHWSQPGICWEDIGSGQLAIEVPARLADGTPNCGTARAAWSAVGVS